jgi:hypothetical protein
MNTILDVCFAALVITVTAGTVFFTIAVAIAFVRGGDK